MEEISNPEHTSKDHYRANSQINQATNRVCGQPSLLCGRQSQIESFDNCDSRGICVQDIGEIHCDGLYGTGSGAVTVWKGIESAACKEGWH
jgi:hypothetical protein